MFCSHCGNEVNEEAIACPKCGTAANLPGFAQTDNKEESTAEQPVIISRMVRTIFEKSIGSTIGSSFVILIGSGFLIIGYTLLSLYVQNNQAPAKEHIPIGMLVTFLLVYPFLIGIQTLLRRRKIELTPDGLYYSNYGISESPCTDSITQLLCVMFIVSQKHFISWKEIHSIEIKDSWLNFQLLPKEGGEEEHSLSLVGFDAPAETIYTNVLDYHNRYKNGYTLVSDSTEPEYPIFQWNKSATWILIWSVIFLAMSLLLTFNELVITVTFCEHMGMGNVDEETIGIISSLLAIVPYCTSWFLVVATMWKVIPSTVRKLNPYLAAFLSIIPFCQLFNFIVIRGWSECLNKAAGHNGQKNICIVGIANLYCLMCLLWLVTMVVGVAIDYNFPEGNTCIIIDVICDIITTVFLLYIVNCVRLLNSIPTTEPAEPEMNFPVTSSF